MNETGFGSPNVNPVISGVQLLFERTDNPNTYNTKKLTSDANWADTCVVAISVSTCGIVLTRVLFTEVNACGTVITRETLSTAAVIAIHPVNTHFVVWTTCLNTVINIHLTIKAFKSYQTNDNVTSVEHHTSKHTL